MDKNVFLKRCEEAGLEYCQLVDVEQFNTVFDLNVRAIEGYENLSDIEKKQYEKFILNFFNTQGVDRKLGFKPISIWRCTQKNTLRFDYKNKGIDEWLHICKSGEEWY